MTTATDDFERADSTSSLGANWTTMSGRNSLGILSGNCYGSVVADGYLNWYSAASFANDQYSEILLGTLETISDEGMGPTVRCSGTNAYLAQTNTTETRLYRKTGGTYAQLGSDAGACASGDTLRLEVQGTSLTVKKNGTTIIGPVTDANFASGSPGIWCYNNVARGQSWRGSDVFQWANPCGWNFRSTLGFVTDPTNTVFEGASASPTNYTIGAETVSGGWTDTGPLQTRDRSTAPANKSLSGIVFVPSAAAESFSDFLVTLPATGSYDIRLAMGDHDNSNVSYWEIYDNTTKLADSGGQLNTAAAGRFYDANNVERTSPADWTSNNTSKTLTFSTTSFKLRLLRPTANSSCVAHMNIAHSAGGGPAANDDWAGVLASIVRRIG